MGHGNEIVIGDANFPGESLGPPCIRLDGISATTALEAILTLVPLDTFVETNAHVMQPVGDETPLPPIFDEFQTIIDRTGDNPAPIGLVERFAFYDRASKAFAVVMTGETRAYGNLILTKGVVL